MNEGENVYITGTFQDYRLIKLSDISYSRSGVAQKSVILWLKPGIYYYKFIVDGKELLDQTKKIEFYNGKIY